MKYLLLFFSFITFAQNQKVILLDNETLEFIDNVNYTLFANKKLVFAGQTSKDSITRLPKEIVFDSISFSTLNYQQIGFKKEHLTDAVLLTKKIYELNEVLISNIKNKEILIGEESVFANKKSRILSEKPDFGILFHENDLNKIVVKRLNFFVEKVKYKTTYKIKFYAAQENGNFMTTQYLKLGELLFESPIFILEKGTKNSIEINLEEYDLNIADHNIFVCIELQSYHDENNNSVQLQIKDKTRLKFQLSKRTNYYSKMQEIGTGKLTDLINTNSMINHDFAFQFCKKPHKSILIAPAIVIYGVKKTN